MNVDARLQIGTKWRISLFINDTYILHRGLASRRRWVGREAQLQAFLAVALHFLSPTCLHLHHSGYLDPISFFKGSIIIYKRKVNSTHTHVDLTIPGHLSLGGLFWWRLSDIIYPPNLCICFGLALRVAAVCLLRVIPYTF